MSVTYRDVVRPLSSIRVTRDHHTRIGVFVEGKLSGELVFGPEQEREVGQLIAVLAPARLQKHTSRHEEALARARQR